MRPVDHVLGLGFQVLGLSSGLPVPGLGLGLSVLGLASNYQALALEVVLGIGLEHSNFRAINPSSPTFILTSFKKYLYFISEQSYSDGCVDS